jgi:hypothetical protein
MSKLEFYARPLVAFDPNNKAHRRWYHEFVEYGGWGKCPVRFICPDSSGFDLTIMIRNQLIEYYVNKEFKSVVKTQQKSKLAVVADKLTAQKTTKTVDKRAKRQYN